MKTSIIIIVALLLNTTLLIAEPLSTIVKDINPLVLLGIEVILLFGYLLHKWLTELHKACTIDLGYLNIFVLKSK